MPGLEKLRPTYFVYVCVVSQTFQSNTVFCPEWRFAANHAE